MSSSAADTDVDLLRDLEFPFSQTCEMGKCHQLATHLVICPCRSGSGYACAKHAAMVQEAEDLPLWILPKLIQDKVRFHRTCGHTVPMTACQVQPL